MIIILLVKHKTLYDQQKQTRQQETVEHHLYPIGDDFMYIETSSNNHGHERVFVSW